MSIFILTEKTFTIILQTIHEQENIHCVHKHIRIVTYGIFENLFTVKFKFQFIFNQ